MKILELTQQIQGIIDALSEEKLKLGRGVYATCDSERDARLTVYSKLINPCNSLNLALTFMATNLSSKLWWKDRTKGEISSADIAMFLREFEAFSKIGFVQSIFSSIESSLRLYLRAVAPSACSQGTASFNSVYECLFKSHLCCEPTQGIELLELLRNVRNTIHNNGVYFSKTSANQQIAWKGNQFSFEHGKPVGFVTWPFLLEIVEALQKMVGQVVTDPKLIGISTNIIDPYSVDASVR